MIDLSFLKRLIETVESSDIDTLEISRWATKIRISKSPSVVYGGNAIGASQLSLRADTNSGEGGAAAAAAPRAADEKAASEGRARAAEAVELIEVTSPMVGTFYRAPAPDADPYVNVGDRVSVGQTLCILEAMKLMNELESEVDGTIREICVENAEPVEYGQVLFRVEPN